MPIRVNGGLVNGGLVHREMRGPIRVGASALPVDLVVNFESGSAGDLITPTYLDANTVGAMPGSWAYVGGRTSTSTLKVASGDLTHALTVACNGNTITGAGSRRAQFDMESLWAGRKTIASFGTGTPATVNTSGAHGLTTGNFVAIEGVTGGAPDINGADHVVTVVDSDTFTINGFALTVAGSGGSARKSYDSFVWSPGGSVPGVVLSGIMQFNATGVTTIDTALDHWNIAAGVFCVMQQLITAGEATADANSTGHIHAHGQLTGGASTFGKTFAIVRATTYLVSLWVDVAGDLVYLLVQDASTFAFVGASRCISNYSGGSVSAVTVQNYLTPHGGTTDVELLCMDWTHQQFPPRTFTLPAATSLTATQTGVGTVLVAWVSGATQFKIERSSNGGGAWSTLDAELVPLTATEYTDATAVDGLTYLYRVTASVATVTAAATTSSSITIDDAIFAVPTWTDAIDIAITTTSETNGNLSARQPVVCGTNGSCVKLRIGIRTFAAPAGLKMALYNNANVKLGQGTVASVTTTDGSWVEVTLVTPVSVSSGTTYKIGYAVPSGLLQPGYVTSGGGMFVDFGTTYAAFPPDPFSGANNVAWIFAVGMGVI